MGKIICFDISTITEPEYSFLYKNVSYDRQIAADRYKSFQDKVRCVAGEAILKHVLKTDLYQNHILKKHISEKAKSFFDTFSLQKDRHGKPYIKEIKDFHFNISHSGKWVVVAYSEKNIGVDIEKIDRGKNPDSIKNIAKRFFRKEECDFIFENEALTQNRFIQIWTAKESYLKYKGVGITKMKDSENTLDLIGKGLYSTVFDNEYYLSCYSKDEQNDVTTLSYEKLKESLAENFNFDEHI